MNAARPQPVIAVLAAGRGARFKGVGHKLAQVLGPYSVLGHVLRNAIASGQPLVVVTTPDFADEAAQLVARRDVVVLGQPGGGGLALGGMGDSIAAAVAARPSAQGWLVLPADMPMIRPATLRRVADGLAAHPVVYAQHHGRRGHPVAFAAELYPDLVQLRGEEGARRVLARYPAQGVEVDDPGVLLDMDTERDLAALRTHWSTAGQATGR